LAEASTQIEVYQEDEHTLKEELADLQKEHDGLYDETVNNKAKIEKLESEIEDFTTDSETLDQYENLPELNSLGDADKFNRLMAVYDHISLRTIHFLEYHHHASFETNGVV